jgi:hypothetical protein
MNGPAPAGGFGGGMAGMQKENQQRLFQMVQHELKQNWNPQGWQQDMQAAERASVIVQMYGLPNIFCFKTCSLSDISLPPFLSR